MPAPAPAQANENELEKNQQKSSPQSFSVREGPLSKPNSLGKRLCKFRGLGRNRECHALKTIEFRQLKVICITSARFVSS